jgi:hypothetical protein
MPVGDRVCEPPATEIQDHVTPVQSLEADGHSPHCAVAGGDVQREVVADVAKRRGTMAGERLGDSPGEECGSCCRIAGLRLSAYASGEQGREQEDPDG